MLPARTWRPQAPRDLDKLSNSFAGRAKFPTPRCNGINDSFRTRGREVSV